MKSMNSRVIMMMSLGTILVAMAACSPNDVSDAHNTAPLSVPPGTPCNANSVRMITCEQEPLCPDDTSEQQICDATAGHYSECFCVGGTNPMLDGGVQPDNGNEWCVMRDPVTLLYTNTVGRKFNTGTVAAPVWTECVVPGTPLPCAIQPALYDACSVGQSICTVAGLNACDAATGQLVCTIATTPDAWSLNPTQLQPLPPTPEVCGDGLDTDCDLVDDSTNGVPTHCSTRDCYRDTDGDLQGLTTDLLTVFNTTVGGTATCPTGRVTAQGDCNDNDAAINSSAGERCFDSVDNNCNGLIDGAELQCLALSCGTDADNDGFAAIGATPVQVFTATCGAGMSSLFTDCDDTTAGRNPNAPEVCNAPGDIDENCNGAADVADGLACNAMPTLWYQDNDGDLRGNPAVTQMTTTPPVGYVVAAGDCDDTRQTVYANAPELCDGLDNDCNPATAMDPGCPSNSCFADTDGDGYGVAPLVSTTTGACPNGQVTNNTDCSPANINVHPGAVEACDGIDNNCVGGIDEGCAACAGNPAIGQACNNGLLGQCARTGTNVCVSGAAQCSVGAVAGTTEICSNGLDEDCDGTPDDGCPPPVGGTFSTTFALAAGTTLVQTNTMLGGFNCNTGPFVIDGTTNFTSVAGTSCTVSTVSGATTIGCSGIPASSNYDVRFCATSGGVTNWIHSSHLAPGGACVLTTSGYANFASMTVSSGTISASTNCGGRACCIHQQ